MPPGGHGPRTYQDERFSYVVLRRGPRADVAAAGAGLQIARHLADAPELDPQLYATRPAHWQERRAQHEVGPRKGLVVLAPLWAGSGQPVGVPSLSTRCRTDPSVLCPYINTGRSW